MSLFFSRQVACRILIGLRLFFLHSVTAFTAALSTVYSLDCSSLFLVDGGDSPVRLLVRLIVSFLTLVNYFRASLLVGLLVGLRLSFLTLVDGFRGSSLVGLLVRLRVSFFYSSAAFMAARLSD